MITVPQQYWFNEHLPAKVSKSKPGIIENITAVCITVITGQL